MRWCLHHIIDKHTGSCLGVYSQANTGMVRYRSLRPNRRVFGKNRHNKSKLFSYEQTTNLQNHRHSRDGHSDVCSDRTGTHVLQRDSDHHHAKRGMAERRHLRRHPNQNSRDVRRVEETLLIIIRNPKSVPFDLFQKTFGALELLHPHCEAVF